MYKPIRQPKKENKFNENQKFNNQPVKFNDQRTNSIQQTAMKATVYDSPKSMAQKAQFDQFLKTPIQKKENNTGLPDNLKSGIENLSGYSMDGVKVHYNSEKPSQLQAHAYAQGTDIHIASGQERHLPHEAWHVVQQKQGRVKPTMQMKGKININDDPHLEKEADVMGLRALTASIKTSNNIHQPNTPFFNRTFQFNGFFLSLLKSRGAVWGATTIGKYVAESPLRMNYLMRARALEESMLVHATQSRIFMDEGIGAPPEMQAEVATGLRQNLKETTRKSQPKWVDEFVKDRQGGKYGTKGGDPTTRNLMDRAITKGALTEDDAAINVILSAGRPQADISSEIVKWLKERGIDGISQVYLSDENMQNFLDKKPKD